MMVVVSENVDGGMEATDPKVPPLAPEDHACADCEVSYADITVAHARDVIANLPARVRASVVAIPPPARHLRPGPGVWSVTEYLCHLRDVYATYTIRLHRTHTEDRPVLEPMLNDLRAQRFRYNDHDVHAVLDQLAATAAGFCEEIDHLGGDDWSRMATRLPGEERTARWLVRQAMHEGVHHLNDIREVGRAVGPTR
jgi:hypothetical protein